MNVVNELKQQVVYVCLWRFACWVSRLLRTGLTIFAKWCSTISQTSLTSSAPTPPSCIIFRKLAIKFHTLPPAKLLWQNSIRLESDSRFRSAFDVISSDPLSSHVSLPLSAWNSASISFSSIHSDHTVGERSNFLTLALHLFSVDSSARPFQSTRFRCSCIKNWVIVVRWSPCALGTSTRTLCPPFEVADDLSWGGRP